MTFRLIVFAFVVTALSSCKGNNSYYTSVEEKNVPDVVDFNFDVRPILSDKCFNCHGPDPTKRAAELRLDLEEEAFKALKNNKNKFAIVKGKPDESEVVLRISTKDSSKVMPPKESNLAGYFWIWYGE